MCGCIGRNILSLFPNAYILQFLVHLSPNLHQMNMYLCLCSITQNESVRIFFNGHVELYYRRRIIANCEVDLKRYTFIIDVHEGWFNFTLARPGQSLNQFKSQVNGRLPDTLTLNENNFQLVFSIFLIFRLPPINNFIYHPQ